MKWKRPRRGEGEEEYCHSAGRFPPPSLIYSALSGLRINMPDRWLAVDRPASGHDLRLMHMDRNSRGLHKRGALRMNLGSSAVSTRR
jgi:hypothetical protein